MSTVYRGRFAPSPTGPLHFGSLVAAVGSYVDARSHGGAWVVRIEDIDPPREQRGAADAILRTLEAFAMISDSPVCYQGARESFYAQAVERLLADRLVYPCACSRREVFESAGTGGVYPGTCRGGLAAGQSARALRVRVEAGAIGFDDRVQGRVSQDVAQEVGDFVVRRADGLFAYQLAVVVDDAEQGITDVVRGADLVDSTPRQIHLQRLLGLREPRYAHLPLVVDAAGQKLGKQTNAAPVGSRPSAEMTRALAVLGCAPPADLFGAPPAEQLDWASANWRIDAVPREVQGVG